MSRIFFFILLPVLVIFPQIAFADIDVQISGNGPGSKSEVSIESNVKSSTTNSQNSTGKVDIRIETNGEVKEYHGEGNTSIHIESSSGNNSVSIINNASGSGQQSASDSASVSAELKQETDGNFNIVEFIKNQFEILINIFSS